MSDFELQIAELKKKIKELEGQKNNTKTYQYSKLNFRTLEELVNIKQNFSNKDSFEKWFNFAYKINEDEDVFFNKLIDKNEQLIDNYSEEDLKANFIIPLLNKVDFLMIENEIRSFYEEKLFYESSSFILSGTTDFLISTGLKYAKKPYFFIQEFKKSKKNDDPEPQLLAELISAVELNNWKTIKGAYIIGKNWSFVILNRSEKHKYEYHISKSFNSTNIDDLKAIYKNLLFVKQEIIEMVKQGE